MDKRVMSNSADGPVTIPVKGLVAANNLNIPHGFTGEITIETQTKNVDGKLLRAAAASD